MKAPTACLIAILHASAVHSVGLKTVERTQTDIWECLGLLKLFLCAELIFIYRFSLLI